MKIDIIESEIAGRLEPTVDKLFDEVIVEVGHADLNPLSKEGVTEDMLQYCMLTLMRRYEKFLKIPYKNKRDKILFQLDAVKLAFPEDTHDKT